MKLDIGYNSPIVLRYEHLSSLPEGVSIAYLSDLHFTGWCGAKTERILQHISQIKPSLILLGGDYVDLPGGLFYLHTLLRHISQMAPVVAITGNHDVIAGKEKLQKLMLQYGVHAIDQKEHAISLSGYHFSITGNLWANRKVETDFHLACLHKPAMPKTQWGYDLVLAGHLHGSQVVWWTHKNCLYPGRFLYPWNGLKFNNHTTTLIVSRGLGDTLPIRFNCPYEIVVVHNKIPQPTKVLFQPPHEQFP